MFLKILTHSKNSASLKKTHTVSMLPGVDAKEKEVAVKERGELDVWKETQEESVRNLEWHALKGSIFFSRWSCSVFVAQLPETSAKLGWAKSLFLMRRRHGWDLQCSWPSLLFRVMFLLPLWSLTQLFLWSLVILGEHKWERYRKGQKDEP